MEESEQVELVGAPIVRGVSICIVTYNTFFYNRLSIEMIWKMTRVIDYEVLIYDNGSTDGSKEWLEEQPNVTLFRGSSNSLKHGEALDLLTRRAKYPICCCLCSDAFPVGPEWLTPAMYLDEEVYLSGMFKEGEKHRLTDYVCPSYLFGWTEWLKRHSFKDNWPNWDTGEKLGDDCFREGHNMKTWRASIVEFQGKFRGKSCDYNGWVWHTWWSVRKQVVEGLSGKEFEDGYHEHVKNLLRERFKLDY